MSAKICFYDIECTNLSASFGFILSFGWKFQGEKDARVISIADYPLYKKDPTNDKMLVQDIAKILNQADIIVGHYSTRFDYPYIQTRLLYHNLPPLSPIPHIDTWRVARYGMKMNSNRLDALAKFLEVKDSKTAVAGNHWVKAMAGDKKALKYVIEHNKLDVLVLEQVYNKIKPIMTNHPNVNIVSEKADSCPVCGVAKLQRRGYSIARTARTPKFFCTGCKAWSKGKPERIKIIQVR